MALAVRAHPGRLAHHRRNESFARLSEYIASSPMYPEWRMFTSFVSTQLGQALALDALRSSHPIEQAPHDETGVDQICASVSNRLS